MSVRVVSSLLATSLTCGAWSAAPPQLRIDGLYHGAGRPIIVEVDGEATAPLTVKLLSASGELKASVPIEPGKPVDLSSAMPALRGIESAHWIQLALAGDSIGAPWVAQPLIERPLLRTTTALRSDGVTKYTRVIGWGDRLLEPDNADYQKLKESWSKSDPTPFSGFRIYPDRDVVLHTDKGDIQVALAPDQAPNTAWNFRTLAEGGLFDLTTFHRVVKFDREGRPFVIQGGDPTGTGDGGPGFDLPMEPSEVQHDFGVISMARNDPPDSAGSQFFFALSREGTARLDHQYCAFGWAVSGADAIVAIADGEIADLTTGKPKSPVVVRSAELVPAPPRAQGKGRAESRVAVPATAPRRTEPDR